MSTRGNGDRAAPLEQRREHLQALGAHYDVDDFPVGLREERLSFLLRDASGHGDNRISTGLLLQDSQLAKTRVELLFGVLAHAAGVDDDHVRVLIVGRGLVSRLIEQPRHPLRVVDVHLTAERLNEIFPGHC